MSSTRKIPRHNCAPVSSTGDRYDEDGNKLFYERETGEWLDEYTWLKKYGEEDGFRLLGQFVEPIVDFSNQAAEVSRHTESPIETIFLLDLKICLEDLKQPFLICSQTDSVPHECNSHLLIIPQFEWKRWRFDLALKWPIHSLPGVLVECDGKEFHSSPEQLANDQRKDEEASKLNIRLLRFTGAEIHRSARACVLAAIAEMTR